MTSGVLKLTVLDRRLSILVFCRPYIVADFRDNVAPLSSEFDFHFLTDGKCPGTMDTRDAFYKHLKAGTRCHLLTPEDEDQIRTRCRMLRSIEAQTAKSLMHAMATVLEEQLERIRPGVVLCQLIDEYITHTLSVLATKLGITTVSYFRSYFPGLVQLTASYDGRPFVCRDSSAEEVDAIYARLTQTKSRQDYNQRLVMRRRQQVYGVARYGVKRVVFAAKSVIERDPWNLHYSMTPYVAERRRISDFPRQTDFAADWQESLKKLKAVRHGPVVYFPLSFYPESTTNYWVANRKILEYDRCIVEIAASLAGSGQQSVVVKEHTHMVGSRNRKLYFDLKNIPGVIIVKPAELSQNVLDLCDAVVLGTGSIGVEAVVAGKPVFSYSDTSYWFRPSGATFLDLNRIDTWAPIIEGDLAMVEPKTEAQKKQFLSDVLRSTVPMHSYGKKWPTIEPSYLKLALLLAAKADVRA